MKKPRKFNRHTAREITEGNLRGRIKTRDGHHVRIVAWDAIGQYPIVGLIYISDLDIEMSWQWTKKGIAFGLDMDPDYDGTVNFDLVIELQGKSTMPQLRRGQGKKRK